MDENAIKPQKQTYDWLKAYQFKAGNNANPKGRPKGQSLKEFAREFLMNLPDEEKTTYLSCLPEELVWKMAEGMPDSKGSLDVSGQININVLPFKDNQTLLKGKTIEVKEIENNNNPA